MSRYTRELPAPQGPPTFLTTYSDMVTLLLAFFVLLFAISTIDEPKFVEFLRGLEDDFGNLSYQERLLAGQGDIIGTGQDFGGVIPFVDGVVQLVPTPTTLVAVPVDNGGSGSVTTTSSSTIAPTPTPSNPLTPTPPLNSGEIITVDRGNFQQVVDALAVVAADGGFADRLTFTGTSEGLHVVLATDDVLFASGSAALDNGTGSAIIGAIAGVLLSFDNDVAVVGHTDNVPTGVGTYDNWNLSVDRAVEVVKLLQDSFSLDPARLSARGAGEFDPLPGNTNSTDEERALNRRVEFLIAFEPVVGSQESQ